jgi:hypothetical protein
VRDVVTLNFLNFSLKLASRLPRESRALMAEIITPSDIESASKHFKLDTLQNVEEEEVNIE